MSIAKITDAYVRHYSDNNQWKAYVEWVDHKGRAGRTEGDAESDCTPVGTHLFVLFARAAREGIETRLEHW